MENLWKPFWDNLIDDDENFFKRELKINEKFKNKYLFGKNVPDNTNKLIALSPAKRLFHLKKRAKKPKSAEELKKNEDNKKKTTNLESKQIIF